MTAYTLMVVTSIFISVYMGLLIICKAIERDSIPSWSFFVWGCNVTAIITHFIGMW